MGQQPKSVPPAAGEIVFLSGWKPKLMTEEQRPWTPYPGPLLPGDVVAGTTYNWTGADLWQVTLAGQGGGSEAPPAAGDTDGKGGKEEGSVS